MNEKLSLPQYKFTAPSKGWWSHQNGTHWAVFPNGKMDSHLIFAPSTLSLWLCDHRWAIGQTACCRGALPVLRSQSKTNCPVSMKPMPWSSLSYWITNYSNILNELKSLAWLDARGQGADPEVKLYRMQSHSATHYQRSKAWGSSTPRSRHMVWQVGYEVNEGHWESAYLIRDGL